MTTSAKSLLGVAIKNTQIERNLVSIGISSRDLGPIFLRKQDLISNLVENLWIVCYYNVFGN